MSITVRHINEDTSFLLLFHADTELPSAHPPSASAVYSILVDPWLGGPSVVTAPWFAITRRVIPACIERLSEIDEPDVVIVSQNKPDHCHRETLQQLLPEGKTIIAAEPGAATAIKSWNHFDPARVQSLPRFNPDKNFSCATFYIPPLSLAGHRGVVTVSFIPAKNYMTGLHNAIGITYLPPTHSRQAGGLQKNTDFFQLPLGSARGVPSPASLTTPGLNIDLQSACPTDVPINRITSHPQNWPQTPSSLQSSFRSQVFSPPGSGLDRGSPASTFASVFSRSVSDSSPIANATTEYHATNSAIQSLPTPPQSPYYQSSTSPLGQQILKSASSSPCLMNNNSASSRPKAFSILYTPHGIPLADIMPYVRFHLVPRGGLPLTVLLHSFHRSTNPWYLGGNITAGRQNGAEIARGLQARYWISAHDEAKDDQGFSVKQLKTTKASPEEVRSALWEGPEGEDLRRKGWCCDVRSLDAGQEVFVGPSRGLVFPTEHDPGKPFKKSEPV